MCLKLRETIQHWQMAGITASSIAGLVIGLSYTGCFQLLEWEALDALFRRRRSEAPDERIVLVTINESDISEMGQWPMSDETLAQLLETIKRQHPRVIGLDLFRDFPVEPGHQKLVEVFKNTPNLIGVEAVLGERVSPPMALNSNQIGIEDILSDEDGKIRRGLLSFIALNDSQVRFSLGTQLALKYLAVDRIALELIDETKSQYHLGKTVFLPFDKNEGGYVNTNLRGYQILLNFRNSMCEDQQGLCPFETVSISQVLQDKIPPGLMEDRIVLIGIIALSESNVFFTPYSHNDETALTGVEIHAHLTSQIVSAALDGRGLIKTWNDLLEGIWIYFWSVLGAILGSIFLKQRWHILVTFVSVIFLCIALFLSCYLAFAMGWWLPVVRPLFALVAAAITTTTYILTENLRQSYQQLEEYAQALEQKIKVIHFSPHPITITAFNGGKHLEVNQSFLDTIGYSKEEVIGQTAGDLNLWVNPEERLELFELLQTHSQVDNYEFQFRTKQGEIRTALLSAETIELNGQHCLLSISNDITERKQVERELEIAKDAADAANQAKSEFLANMSHELRTPLNAILGFTRLIRRLPQDSHEQKDYLEIIHHSGEHLLSLINDVLDLSKIEAGRMTLDKTEFDLFQTLKTLEEMLKLKAQAKGLQLIFNPDEHLPQFIKTDERKLRQILINLLGNAIKFTEEGSVTLEVYPAETIETGKKASASVSLIFEVKDTGLGIAPEELEDLFEAFKQTETGRQAKEGTGLGLTISRKFIQLMGGEITVQSTVGEGTTFQFNLQVQPIKNPISIQPSPGKIIALAPEQPSYRILAVDDHWENRQLLLKLLTPLGFEVREAVNGVDAVSQWERWQPHLIWMDMQMPVMNGYEATQNIRQREQTQQPQRQPVVIVALTASSLKIEQQGILSAGVNEILSKPFKEDVLLGKIAELLGVRYIYETPQDTTSISSAAQQEPLTAEDLLVMPSEWVQGLHQAARSGDDEMINTFIQKIPDQYSHLMTHLNQLNIRYDFRKIRELTARE